MCSRVYSTSWLFTLSDQLTSKLDTCHSEIKRRTEILFISLSVINLIQLHDAKVKLICIVIASILDIDGWYINLSSMDDGGHQPHPFTIWAWHCISHIQGISLLGDNGRVTPLHPPPPDWRYQITSLDSLPHRGHWWIVNLRVFNTSDMAAPNKSTTPSDLLGIEGEEVDYGSDVESKVSTPVQDDSPREAPI